MFSLAYLAAVFHFKTYIHVFYSYQIQSLKCCRYISMKSLKSAKKIPIIKNFFKQVLKK